MENLAGHKPHELEYLPIIAGGKILHYTCNAPSQEVLDKNKIECYGTKFKCVDKREVLGIPVQLYSEKGFLIESVSDKNILQINLEILLRDLK